MENLDIRIIVSEKGLKYQDIADEMNITPQWLSRLMKKKLTTENRIRILKAITNLEKGETDGEIQ